MVDTDISKGTYIGAIYRSGSSTFNTFCQRIGGPIPCRYIFSSIGHLFQGLKICVPVLNRPAKTQEQPCQHETYDPTGTYESPGYPDAYPNRANCAYRIFTDKMIDVS